MSQSGIWRLISRLNKDFGRDFLITLAPIASALDGGGNLSGFDYHALETSNGDHISWYNGQFYNGRTTMGNPAAFEKIVRNGFKAGKVVAGQLTSTSDGNNYLSPRSLNATIVKLRKEYGQIGGVIGWEYFNSEPGRTAEPWKWAQVTTQILRPNGVPDLGVKKSLAEHLQRTYADSWAASGHSNKANSKLEPLVKYMDAVKN